MMKEPVPTDQPNAEDGRKDGGDDLAESDVALSSTEAAPEERNDAQAGGLRQWATVILGLLVTVLFSGPIFGWASWQPMLEEDGVYRDLCDSSEPLCEARSSRMVLLYTVGQMAATIGLAVVSFLTDRAGPLFLVVAGGAAGFGGAAGHGPGRPARRGKHWASRCSERPADRYDPNRCRRCLPDHACHEAGLPCPTTLLPHCHDFRQLPH